MYKCLVSFASPTVSYAVGEIITKKLPKTLVKDLLKAGYIKEVTTASTEAVTEE